MDIYKLEELLAFGRETPTLDYKDGRPWDTEFFLKHIIAMANNRDVSYIVIGVKENKQTEPRYTCEGISEPKILQSYEEDKMKGQIHKHVDQAIKFEVFKPKDSKNRQYVVIRITPSSTPPVFCTKPFGNIVAGQIFVRSEKGPVRSCPIEDTKDMERFIKQAAEKYLAQLYQEGLSPSFVEKETVTSKDLDEYQQERGTL